MSLRRTVKQRTEIKRFLKIPIEPCANHWCRRHVRARAFPVPAQGSTGISDLKNLVRVYSALGRYAEAESLFLRSLSIKERVLGPEHPDVAKSLNNLARLHYILGRYAEATEMEARTKAIRTRHGKENP